MSPIVTKGETMRLSGKIEFLDSDQYYEEKKKIMKDNFSRADLENKEKILQISAKNFEYFKKAAEIQNII